MTCGWAGAENVGRQWCGAPSGLCALGAGGGLPFRVRASKWEETDDGTVAADVVNMLMLMDDSNNASEKIRACVPDAVRARDAAVTVRQAYFEDVVIGLVLCHVV